MYINNSKQHFLDEENQPFRFRTVHCKKWEHIDNKYDELERCCFDISSSEVLSAKWGRGILNNLLLNKAECIVLHSMAQ